MANTDFLSNQYVKSETITDIFQNFPLLVLWLALKRQHSSSKVKDKEAISIVCAYNSEYEYVGT